MHRAIFAEEHDHGHAMQPDNCNPVAPAYRGTCGQQLLSSRCIAMANDPAHFSRQGMLAR
jgi:hypothetical protein